MNRMIGALAMLLLVAAVAMGQQSPFPSAANPSLEPNTNEVSAVTLSGLSSYRRRWRQTRHFQLRSGVMSSGKTSRMSRNFPPLPTPH